MMSHKIFQILDSLGLVAQNRVLHVQFSNASLNNQVFLQRIEGEHTLNQGSVAELLCLSTNAHIALKQFIGCQVAVDQVTDTGQFFRTTGIITEASQGQSDGSLTIYNLTLKDPTALWHKRRNSRVFMNKSVRDISEILFKEWQEKSPLFASSITLDTSGLTKDYDVRPFVMQSNESDYDFLTRLWRSEGINWLVDESQLFVADPNASIQPQVLRLIDDNQNYQALERRSIRYQRSSATEQFDTITQVKAERRLQPTSVHVQRWQADALQQEEGSGSVQGTQKHSEHYDTHVREYDVDIMNLQRVSKITGADQTANGLVEVELENGAKLESKTVILSTGARWREMNVPGEAEYRTRGVAYCPHCDGPLFKGKRVAVIGGGNSGVEAAIDLAGIVEHVTLVEFDTKLRADQVLQNKLNSLPNTTVIMNALSTEVLGDGSQVTGLKYKDRATDEEHVVELAGIFVQIGLLPNTDFLKDSEVELTNRGEIIVNDRNETNVKGVFAAGDCTTVPYKQIIIATGEGAKASLSAFDYIIRSEQ
ncbi:contractile injection system protein, VgrG/Pvc8 family [Acinetobacter baumannii]|nr:contractile injection system protein, VgrG/Pvc8 family [Acinetobacter baumannii]WSI12895.1 contractile injection system protein, VgrG/Pvc8 family [Acinetobacter baumannii]